MSTRQLESLWQYIQTLSLSKKNREWLAARLVEPTSKPTVLTGIQQAEQDVEEGRVSEAFTSPETLFQHLGI